MKVLAIFAHIEDHICFGWPLMQDEKIEKHLIVGTNDGNGTLQKSCDDAGIHLFETLGFPNGLYRKTLAVDGVDSIIAAQLMCEVLYKAIKEIEPDYIFTHNPWGEYGHFDHRLIFESVYKWDMPILITDIVARSVCFLSPEWRMFKSFYTEHYMTVESDYEFYSRQRDIFKESGLWTHNQYLDKPYYPPETVGLYKIFEFLPRRIRARKKEVTRKWTRAGGLNLEYKHYDNISSDSVVFDIGLHKGLWSKKIAEKYNSHIYGFEPVKKFCQDAEESLAEYPKVKIFNFGLGGLTRQSIIAVEGTSTTLVGAGTMFTEHQAVSIKSIKEFMAEQEIDFVDLASINIEGAEYELLNFLFDTGLISKFGTIILQLHEHINSGDIGHFDEREAIRKKLNATHKNIYCYDITWELWKKRK